MLGLSCLLQLTLLLFNLCSCAISRADDCVVVDSEDVGHWSGHVMLGPWEEDVSTWSMVISFTEDLDWLDCALATVSGQGRTWTLTSKDWDGDIAAGDELEVRFMVQYSGQLPEVVSVTTVTETCDGVVNEVASEDGQWTGQVTIQAGDQDMEGWHVLLMFSAPVDYIGENNPKLLYIVNQKLKTCSRLHQWNC